MKNAFAVAALLLSLGGLTTTEAAHAQSSVNADAALGALDRKDCEGVMDALNRGMAGNEPRSFYVTGQLYESGVCLRSDPARAAQAYERAALQGDSASSRSLALIHARGAGVPQSYREAGRWYGVMRQEQQPAEAYASPEAVAKTYVDAVHDLAAQLMVYPRDAAVAGVRGSLRMRFDPVAGTATVVSSTDNAGSSMNHLGPGKRSFERALLAGYDAAITTLPKPIIPAVGSYATERDVPFDRNPNAAAGPSGLQQLRR